MEEGQPEVTSGLFNLRIEIVGHDQFLGEVSKGFEEATDETTAAEVFGKKCTTSGLSNQF